MFGRKRDLAKTLQRRYFVDDSSQVLFWILIVCRGVAGIFLGLAVAKALVGWPSWDLWSATSLFKLCIGLVFAAFTVSVAAEIYIDLSHWLDNRAANRGWFIPFGEKPSPLSRLERIGEWLLRFGFASVTTGGAMVAYDVWRLVSAMARCPQAPCLAPEDLSWYLSVGTIVVVLGGIICLAGAIVMLREAAKEAEQIEEPAKHEAPG